MLTTAEPHPEQVPDEVRPVDMDSPPCMVPVPARLEQPLRDRRVVLHDPAAPATRYDLFAVTEVDADNRVGIVDAPAYYAAARRNGLDELARRAGRVDVDALWVERLYPDWDSIPAELHPPEVRRPRYMPPEVPVEHPIQPPIRRLGLLGLRLAGARAMLAWRHGDGTLVTHQGYRVISEGHLYDNGQPNLSGDLDDLDQPELYQAVTLCDEADYFAWADTGATPATTRVDQLCAVLLD